MAPQRARAPGSRAAVLLLIVIQPYRYTVNASFQLHRHIANTQNSSASPPNGLSGRKSREKRQPQHTEEQPVSSHGQFLLSHPVVQTMTRVSMVNPWR